MNEWMMGESKAKKKSDLMCEKESIFIQFQ